MLCYSQTKLKQRQVSKSQFETCMMLVGVPCHLLGTIYPEFHIEQRTGNATLQVPNSELHF